MKANELRSGNLVQGLPLSIPILGIYSDGITAITAYGISLIADGVLDFKPIPLTYKWLNNFGFENGGYESLSWYKKSEHNNVSFACMLEDDKEEIIMGVRYNDETEVRLVYVHQLQNLYFALTGEELELKKVEKQMI